MFILQFAPLTELCLAALAPGKASLPVAGGISDFCGGVSLFLQFLCGHGFMGRERRDGRRTVAVLGLCECPLLHRWVKENV